ncbi:MAG: YfhO family protein [Pyrinomonadaceae bacterium]
MGAVALGYGAFISTVLILKNWSGATRTAWGTRPFIFWRPLAVAAGAVLFSTGIAAFQIFETMRAVRRSVRSALTYETFAEGSYTHLLQIKSFLAPFYYYIDTEAYVLPLAVVLAISAVVIALRDSAARDVRVLFWLALAVTAWILMMGANTPVYRVMYLIPLVNRFRVPSRHTFEWTFAIGILSAYGWDVVRSRIAQRSERRVPARHGFAIGSAFAVSLLMFIVGAIWWFETGNPKTYESKLQYFLLKLLFTVLTLIAFWLSCRVGLAFWRGALLCLTICLSCFVEPYILISRWWFPLSKTKESLFAVSPPTRFLQQYAPQENRIYTRCPVFAEHGPRLAPVDTHNTTALFGLQNVGGYEPLIFHRYSRALGNISLDSVHPRSGFPPDRSLLTERSHVLDLLNNTFFVSCPDPENNSAAKIEKEGIVFNAPTGGVELKPGATDKFKGAAGGVDTIAVVASLANSVHMVDGEPVATLRITSSDDRVIERKLLAGRDTAEWAHERSDVKRAVRHKLAPVFESSPGDGDNSFTAHRYWTRVALDETVNVAQIEITNVSQRATLSLWKMTLYDSQNNRSVPLALSAESISAEKWEQVYDRDGVVIMRNRRALPRAWLVAEAEAVDGEEALRLIRGESERAFDPRRTALLEVKPGELPTLPGGRISLEATARVIAYEPTRVEIETSTATPAVLMLSEMYYPGWEATIDGGGATILNANYLLRAVAVPAGTHRIEMRYVAPAMWTGLCVSVFSLLLLAGLFFWPSVARKKLS